MPSLLIFEGSYYSQLDEAAFFRWLESISGVQRITGTSNGLRVTLRTSRLSETSLRDLLALHWRYKLPMRDLARFLSESNEGWFTNPVAYWHDAVFGRSAISADLDARLQELYAQGKSAARATTAIRNEYQLQSNEAERRIFVSKLWGPKTAKAKVQAARRAKTAA
jgi:hypothetical protein